MVAHDFHDGTAMMRRTGITQFIHAFHTGLKCCIKADRQIRTGNIVIDRTGQANTVNALFR